MKTANLTQNEARPVGAFHFRVKTLVSGRKQKGSVILSFSMYIALKNGTCTP